MQDREAMGEVAASGIAEDGEAPPILTVLVRDLGHHGEHDRVVADVALSHVFVAAAVSVAEHADREDRAEDGAAVPAAELGEAVTEVEERCAAGAVHGHQKLDLLSPADRWGHVETVVKAWIGLTGEDRGRAEIIDGPRPV